MQQKGRIEQYKCKSQVKFKLNQPIQVPAQLEREVPRFCHVHIIDPGPVSVGRAPTRRLDQAGCPPEYWKAIGNRSIGKQLESAQNFNEPNRLCKQMPVNF